jgi:hypothetical protein
MRAWVIGSGGLLGHAITREAQSRDEKSAGPVWLHAAPRIPWSDETEAIRVLKEQAHPHNHGPAR